MGLSKQSDKPVRDSYLDLYLITLNIRRVNNIEKGGENLSSQYRVLLYNTSYNLIVNDDTGQIRT